mmetsp:Transcript_11915/g.13727  ORF Transcript_11915/g.13727 Transcript_11915/m.13727 type:complete len:185 (+) Transcript_11915:183-737(+)|eukprot:CAMPEP_0184023204 /NCGR_PEP_ID=MMETSP0954-20121128/11196_1 /TAXON_ID=627963 /ORGANISM="Aplanochytrium sp, Strain PBS07" /LENGTH=184 /DNA_ID=CAMNT_0026305993 /DNA_START=217 /DNA_END=771 /DNA_ORIENTATION=+
MGETKPPRALFDPLLSEWASAQQQIVDSFERYEAAVSRARDSYSIQKVNGDHKLLKVSTANTGLEKSSKNLGGVPRISSRENEQHEEIATFKSIEDTLFELHEGLKLLKTLLLKLRRKVVSFEKGRVLNDEIIQVERLLASYQNEYDMKESIITSLKWDLNQDIISTYRLTLECQPFLGYEFQG